MTPEDESFLRLDFISTMLAGEWLDKIAVHHSLRDARKILGDFEERIKNRQALTDKELAWLDWFSFQTTYFIRSGNGEWAGQWVLVDGVYTYELSGTPILKMPVEIPVAVEA